MTKNQFGETIRQARQKKGWTQLDLARALGYDNPQFVSLLERNQSKVPLKVLGQLIVLLGLPEDELVTSLMNEFEAEIQNELQLGKRMARASA